VIGGATQWYWDEALSSLLLAFLEPAGRPPAIQAWFTADILANAQNSIALDCGPIGTVYDRCNFSSSKSNGSFGDREGEGGRAREGKRDTSKVDALSNVYPYNKWAYALAINTHMRINNDTEFLNSKAGTSNLTVDEALENLTLDWMTRVIPGTSSLVDYGSKLDGFSHTYEHVMPGMQGNNIWMLRQLARLRELQGQQTKSSHLYDLAKTMATETIATMFQSRGDRGWFNLIWPVIFPLQNRGFEVSL